MSKAESIQSIYHHLYSKSCPGQPVPVHSETRNSNLPDDRGWTGHDKMSPSINRKTSLETTDDEYLKTKINNRESLDSAYRSNYKFNRSSLVHSFSDTYLSSREFTPLEYSLTDTSSLHFQLEYLTNRHSILEGNHTKNNELSRSKKLSLALPDDYIEYSRGVDEFESMLNFVDWSDIQGEDEIMLDSDMKIIDEDTSSSFKSSAVISRQVDDYIFI